MSHEKRSPKSNPGNCSSQLFHWNKNRGLLSYFSSTRICNLNNLKLFFQEVHSSSSLVHSFVLLGPSVVSEKNISWGQIGLKFSKACGGIFSYISQFLILAKYIVISWKCGCLNSKVHWWSTQTANFQRQIWCVRSYIKYLAEDFACQLRTGFYNRL